MKYWLQAAFVKPSDFERHCSDVYIIRVAFSLISTYNNRNLEPLPANQLNTHATATATATDIMGKRKKAAKPASSKKGVRLRITEKQSLRRLTIQQKENLPTSFQCLFCNHEQSVSVKMDKKSAIGHLSCKVCGQDFDASINCS